MHLQEYEERHPQGSATLCSVMTLSNTIPTSFYLCVHLLEFLSYMVTLCLWCLWCQVSLVSGIFGIFGVFGVRCLWYLSCSQEPWGCTARGGAAAGCEVEFTTIMAVAV